MEMILADTQVLVNVWWLPSCQGFGMVRHQVFDCAILMTGHSKVTTKCEDTSHTTYKLILQFARKLMVYIYIHMEL